MIKRKKTVFLISAGIILAVAVYLIICCLFDASFLSSEKSGKSLKIGWITDIQHGEKNYGDKLSTLGVAAINNFLDHCNQESVDFVVSTGDMVSDRNIKDDAVLKLHERVKDELEAFRGSAYYVLGNHDVCDADKDRVVDLYNMPNNYYSFKERGIKFIVLDQQFNEDGSSYKDGNCYFGGHLPQKELEWLKNEVDSAGGKVVVLAHQPLIDFGGESMMKAKKIRNIFSSSGKVIAVLQGHIQPTEEQKHQLVEGVHYFTLSSPTYVETRLNHAIMEIDLESYKIKLNRQMDKNNELLVELYHEANDKCGAIEDEDTHEYINNLSWWNKFKIWFLYKRYGDEKYWNIDSLRADQVSNIKAYADSLCYDNFLRLREEFKGY
ncbi:MAG: metallophosphoesterase [Candidatus Moranbacteria bacterium]|nr:metallophosphoesterase [Candidatus Moranbacteria bacterium]